MFVGVNTYGLKDLLYQDFEGTLKALKEAQLDAVEICIFFWNGAEPSETVKAFLDNPALDRLFAGIWLETVAGEKLAALRAAGILVNSAHVTVLDGTPETMAQAAPKLATFAREHGIRYCVWSPMKNLSDIRPYVEAVNRCCDILQEAGAVFALHNHEIECMNEDGTTVLDYLMEHCPKLKLELDAGWAKYARTDAVAWMRKYKERLVLLHLKDIREDACPENRATCFTAIGEGSIPLQKIMEEAVIDSAIDAFGVIIDQDASQGDMMRDLTVGARNIRNCCGE